MQLSSKDIAKLDIQQRLEEQENETWTNLNPEYETDRD